MPRNSPDKKAQRFRKGMKSIPERMLNTLVDGVNRPLIGSNKPKQTAGFGYPKAHKLTVTSQSGDYITCDTPSGKSVDVAKPYLLRRTPFDGETRDGITYTYSSDSARQGDDGANTEDQVIVPSYVVNDIIFAVRNPVGGTGVDDGESPATNITYLDLNLDGRAWAKEDAST